MILTLRLTDEIMELLNKAEPYVSPILIITGAIEYLNEMFEFGNNKGEVIYTPTRVDGYFQDEYEMTIEDSGGIEEENVYKGYTEAFEIMEEIARRMFEEYDFGFNIGNRSLSELGFNLIGMPNEWTIVLEV